MVPAEAADPVIACFEQAVERYGRPEGVMSDRGSAFHAWRGLSRFESLLEEYEVNYYLAKEAAVNGKVEALNASFQKECESCSVKSGMLKTTKGAEAPFILPFIKGAITA